MPARRPPPDSPEAARGILEGVLRRYERVVVAYSGGVDSTLLAVVAHEVLGDGSLAVTAVSPSLARRELRAARALARARGLQHRLVRTREVSRPEYARNSQDRCYWCKSELFDVLEPVARERDAVVCLGTNTDDLSDRRPGLVAAAERGVASPLVEAGLGKRDVRELSRRMGLPTADKPASPCLASRFAYGVRVTPAGLRRVEAAEEAVRAFGFDELRVRDLGGRARVEVAPASLERARALWDRIAPAVLATGFETVELDPRGFRSGALNELLPPPRLPARP